MSKRYIRQLQGGFPRALRQLWAGWFTCGELLPWRKPKSHVWPEGAYARGLFVCRRCDHRIGGPWM